MEAKYNYKHSKSSVKSRCPTLDLRYQTHSNKTFFQVVIGIKLPEGINLLLFNRSIVLA